MLIGLTAAIAFNKLHHRHLPHVQGGKFALGLYLDTELRGVAIIGRPTARADDDGVSLGLTRCAVVALTPNGCSQLYGAAWRETKARGYRRLITYTRVNESGASLRASNATMVRGLISRREGMAGDWLIRWEWTTEKG